MTNAQEDVQVIINRANIALACSQRIIQSWLPEKTEEEEAQTKTEEELEQEDRELFKPVPELLGVGAPLPQDNVEGSANHGFTMAEAKLRRQLLGKKAVLGKMREREGGQVVAKAGKKGSEDSDEGEEGRSSIFPSKRVNRKVDQHVEGDEGDDTIISKQLTHADQNEEADRSLAPRKKRPNNFLDEMLQERSKKAKKRKKRKAQRG